MIIPFKASVICKFPDSTNVLPVFEGLIAAVLKVPSFETTTLYFVPFEEVRTRLFGFGLAYASPHVILILLVSESIFLTAFIFEDSKNRYEA